MGEKRQFPTPETSEENILEKNAPLPYTIPNIYSKCLKYLYLRDNKIKSIEDLYNNNYKSWKKNIEKYSRKWKDISYSWIDN